VCGLQRTSAATHVHNAVNPDGFVNRIDVQITYAALLPATAAAVFLDMSFGAKAVTIPLTIK
jgi:hypothetical protein